MPKKKPTTEKVERVTLKFTAAYCTPAREKGKTKNKRKGTPAQTFKKIWDWM